MYGYICVRRSMHGILTLLEQLTNPKTPSHFDPYGHGYSQGTPHKTYNCYKYTSKNRFVRHSWQIQIRLHHPTSNTDLAPKQSHDWTNSKDDPIYFYTQANILRNTISANGSQTPSNFIINYAYTKCDGESQTQVWEVTQQTLLNQHHVEQQGTISKAQSPNSDCSHRRQRTPKMVDSIQIRRVWGQGYMYMYLRIHGAHVNVPYSPDT